MRPLRLRRTVEGAPRVKLAEFEQPLEDGAVLPEIELLHLLQIVLQNGRGGAVTEELNQWQRGFNGNRD